MPAFGSSNASSPPNYGGRGSRGSGRIPRSDLLIIGSDAPRASRRSGRSQKPPAPVVTLVVRKHRKLKASFVLGEVANDEAKTTTDIYIYIYNSFTLQSFVLFASL